MDPRARQPFPLPGRGASCSLCNECDLDCPQDNSLQRWVGASDHDASAHAAEALLAMDTARGDTA